MGIGERIFGFCAEFLKNIVFSNEMARTWMQRACEKGGKDKVVERIEACVFDQDDIEQGLDGNVDEVD